MILKCYEFASIFNIEKPQVTTLQVKFDAMILKCYEFASILNIEKPHGNDIASKIRCNDSKIL